MKKIFFIHLFLMTAIISFARQKTFDIIRYSPPGNWAENQGNSNISYSRIEGGAWAQIAIYAHRNSEGNIQADFDKDWNELVATGRNISSPEKTDPQPESGCSVMSGSGVWQYNGSTVTSVLTVYSNNKICVAILCNSTATSLLKEYQTLKGTIDIDAGDINTDNIQQSTGNNGQTANSSTVVGLWVINQPETNGFINGHRLYTGGYLRKEYQLQQDGTYIFRVKNWSVNNEAIYFVCESGTWKVNGNQLTLTPKKGKAGWWNKDKPGNDVKKWGAFKKSAEYKLQVVTYSYEIKEDPNYGNSIVLNTGKPTERDGGQFNSGPYRFAYTSAKEAYIDNPPGFKTGF